MSDIDAPDPKFFDLKAALAHRTYASETVPVFLDEQLMYDYSKVALDADYDPTNKDKQAKRDELLETFKGIAIKVTVKSVPIEDEEAVVEELVEEYPPNLDMWGNEVPNREALDKLNTRLWALHIIRMETPDGSFNNPDESDIEALRKHAPKATLDVIAETIKGLNKRTRSGYDTIVKDPDFLSQPSLTA